MRLILEFLSVALLVLLGMLLLVALFLAWSLGVGWLLQQIVPLTFFEASLLAIVASLAAGAIMIRLFSLPQLSVNAEQGQEEPDWFDEPLSFTRFYPAGRVAALEHWAAFRLANEIFLDLLANASPGSDEATLEDSAIDLAEIGLGVLKRKPPGTKRVLVTLDAMQKEASNRHGEGYDDEHLGVAVQAINNLLDEDDDLARIVRRQRWDEPVLSIIS